MRPILNRALGPLAASFIATSAAAEPPHAPAPHLQPQDTIGELLENPAFAGFADRTLPWAGRRYDTGMPIAEVASLLPYHRHVDPGTVVDGLNRMIDDANAGRRIFYPVYPEADRQARPELADVGLFFFRGEAGAPFAVVSPGGGFAYVGSVHEGFPYAAEISRHGYNAFVLTYRTGQGGAVATRDLAAALTFITARAAELEVATADYSLWGSSAGARMAAAIGSHGAAAFGGDDLPKPAAVVMAYTGHSDTSADEPPTFVIVGEKDGISPPGSMERRVATLRRTGTEVEYRRYEDLGHGFGPGIGTDAEGWIADAVRFWGAAIKNGDAE
jgi:acetyl esterase/lipase